MGLEGVKEKKLLYHLTKLSNMEDIINYGLLPRRYLLQRRRKFDDVADSQIISKRVELDLDKFTPFHFHPYSAFDVAVKNTYSTDKFVYVPDEETKQYIERLFHARGIMEQPPYVSTRPNWF